MREARLIVPAKHLIKLKQSLVQEFGGYTVIGGNGMWANKAGQLLPEFVVIFDIAYEPSWENDAKLFDIADEYRIEAKQEEVYLRYGNGNVQFVKANDCMDNGEKEPFEWERLRQDLNEPADEEEDTVYVAEHVAL